MMMTGAAIIAVGHARPRNRHGPRWHRPALCRQVPDRIDRMAVFTPPKLAVILLERLFDELVHRRVGVARKRMR